MKQLRLVWIIAVSITSFAFLASVISAASPSSVTDENTLKWTFSIKGGSVSPQTILLGVPHSDVVLRIDSAESIPLESSHATSAEPLVTLKTDLQLRDQHIVQLTFNPVQPTPNGARLFTTVTIELQWAESGDTSQHATHPVYEQLLASTLNNYANLNRPASQTAPAPQVTRAQVTTPTLRITVPETGLYQLTYANLLAAGFPLDSVNLQLTNRSIPIATLPIGLDDGQFEAGDAILFFGEAYEDVYTDQNVYWLTIGSGMEMGNLAETHPSATPATQFATTTYLEENNYYWNTMPDGAGKDHWFWGNRISPNTDGLDSVHYITTTLPTLAASPTVTLRAQLEGFTALTHQTRLYLNNTLIDTQSWAGQNGFAHTVAVTGSLLVAGDNFITVEAIDSGATVDQLLINWIEIDHAVNYQAVNDHLLFSPPAGGTYAFTVTGFTTDTLHLLDITNPHQPIQINHTMHNGSLHFQRTVTEGTRFFASAVATVPQIVLDEASNWRDAGNSADWVIISHANFITAAQRLADHRATQSIRPAVVNVQDIYDEFNHGLFSPIAIRDFLAHAYTNWKTPAPIYVVLLGDGSQDYKNWSGSGQINFVPPQMIETDDFGQVPSDNWYVQLAGNDVLPDMMIGRLSAETVTHATNIVDNIITYDTLPAPTTYNAIYVADDRDTVFESISEGLIRQLPTVYTNTRHYASNYTTGLTQAITESLHSGAALVNYSGHGNYYRWGSYPGGRIFTEAHVDTIANSNSFPFWTVANCLNGFFSTPSTIIIEPYDEAFAEAVQRQPNGGAIGLWADSGFGYPSGQRLIMTEFYDALFEDELHTLGVSTEAAKLAAYTQSTYWARMVETMLLFGDPATKLAVEPFVPTSQVELHQLSADSNLISQHLILLFLSLSITTILWYRKV